MHGKYGIFPLMGNAGFISSTVTPETSQCSNFLSFSYSTSPVVDTHKRGANGTYLAPERHAAVLLSLLRDKPPPKKNPTKNTETQQPSTPNPKPSTPNPKPLNPTPLPPKQKQLAPPWAPLGPRWRAPVPGPGSHVDAPRPDWSSFGGPGVGAEALRFRAV